MRYRRALDRLYGLSGKGVTLGLDRISKAALLLGNPQQQFDAVQIAGTNGKGTVSATLAEALRIAGLRTGLFTSPHLHRFAERIRVDGLEASETVLERHLIRVLDLNDDEDNLSLSFFEVATLAAFLTFAELKVDIAVLEVGLGGRLDATGVASPVLTAVTSIGMDHTAQLGNTLGEIAAEKAGIARRGVPLVAGALPAEAMLVVERHCREIGAPIAVFDRDFSWQNKWVAPWPGRHHRSNLAVAAELYKTLAATSSRLTPEAFEQALTSVQWPGRFEVIERDRRYILDCAHNLEAAHALVRTLKDVDETPKVLIFGALKDKPAAEMLALYRKFAGQVVLMPPPIQRAQDPAQLASARDTVVSDAASALEAATRLSRPTDTVLVTGSLFTVAAVRQLLLGEKGDPPVGL